jgi:hypothetical protein
MGPFKSQGPKLFPLFKPIGHPNLSVVIAGAGNVPFMRSVVSKLEGKLAGLNNPTIVDVRDSAEKVLVDFYNTHVYSNAGSYKSPGFELLMGVWAKNGGFGLLKTDDTTVNIVTDLYCCIGEGVPLSEYAIDLAAFDDLTTVENAKFIATFCIKAAKDKIGSCGGKTKMWALREDNSACRMEQVAEFEITEAEDCSIGLFDDLKYILLCMDENFLADDKLDDQIGELKNRILEFRKKRREIREKAAQRAAIKQRGQQSSQPTQ